MWMENHYPGHDDDMNRACIFLLLRRDLSRSSSLWQIEGVFLCWVLPVWEKNTYTYTYDYRQIRAKIPPSVAQSITVSVGQAYLHLPVTAFPSEKATGPKYKLFRLVMFLPTPSPFLYLLNPYVCIISITSEI